MPPFILDFLVAVTVNSSGVTPSPLAVVRTFASQLVLTASVYAVCTLTLLFDITRAGVGPVAMVVLATLFILCFALTASAWLMPFSGG